MSECFLGEIRVVAFDYAPEGWAKCDGAEMQISQNEALHSLLGVQFGGNGTTTFNLPDMRGRCPVGQGPGIGLTPKVIGQFGGTENAKLQPANMPIHNHMASIGGTVASTFNMSGNQGDIDDSTGAMFAKIKTGITFQKGYKKVPSTVITMSPNSVTLDTSKLTTTISDTGLESVSGISVMQPFSVLNYIIATTGTYPTS